MDSSRGAFGKFLLLWSGGFVTAIGSGLTSFGLAVYVFEQTGKASATALVALLAFAPSLLLSAVAGVLADRYDRRLLTEYNKWAQDTRKRILQNIYRKIKSRTGRSFFIKCEAHTNKRQYGMSRSWRLDGSHRKCPLFQFIHTELTLR